MPYYPWTPLDYNCGQLLFLGPSAVGGLVVSTAPPVDLLLPESVNNPNGITGQSWECSTLLTSWKTGRRRWRARRKHSATKLYWSTMEFSSGLLLPPSSSPSASLCPLQTFGDIYCSANKSQRYCELSWKLGSRLHFMW